MLRRLWTRHLSRLHRWWMSDCREKSTRQAEGRRRTRRPALETLEDRITPAPALVTDFAGITFDENGVNNGGGLYIPPDPSGAAGPGHVVSVVNKSIEWHTVGGTQQHSDDLLGFFAPLLPLTEPFDPKVIYDQFQNRFVVVALEQTDTSQGDVANTSRILVAVSDDSDPNGTWFFTPINSKISISGVDSWADYPGFAVDEEAVYITNNMFGFGSSGTFGGVRLWIINKGVSGGFYGGGAASVTVHNPYAATPTDATTTQPAYMYAAGPGNAGTFLVSYGFSDGTNEFLQIVRVDNPLSSPTFSKQFVNVGNIDDTSAGMPDAPQSGSGTAIETNDRRAINAVWRNNQLWTTAQVVPGSGADAGQATVHWWNLNTTNVSAITVNDQGNVGGEDIAAGTHTFMPSLAVDEYGNMGIGFAASGPNIFAGAYYTGRAAGDSAGTVQSVGTLKAGADFYVRTFGGGSNRWGDYSATALAPDGSTFWIFNEYAMTRGTAINGEDGRWATHWGAFTFGADFGDAPDSYGTLLASNGARHADSGLRLGSIRDAETNAPSGSLNGLGDDTTGSDDEDGVLLTGLIPGGTGRAGITVSGTAGKLDAWIDFNRDGDFNDSGERISAAGGTAVAVGANVITFTVPAGSSYGQTYARFRLSTLGGLSPTGAAIDGEVEDYRATIGVSRIAFGSQRDGDFEIYAMNPDGTGQVQLTHNTADDNAPVWSPDGTRVAFHSNRDGNYDIFVMNADGANQVNLSKAAGSDFEPAWSPDGSKILFASDRDGANNFNVYVMNADGANQTRLTTDAASDVSPTWSPDGNKIAFSAFRDGNSEIYLMDPDGTNQTNISNNGAPDYLPDWSPDGAKIVFVSDRTGNGDIYVMDANGANQAVRAGDANVDRLPAWSPDGSQIAFDSARGAGGTFDIFVMNADGSGVSNLTNTAGRIEMASEWGVVPSAITTVQLSSGNLLVNDAGGKSDQLIIRKVGANVRVIDPTNAVVAGNGTTQIDAHTIEVPFSSISGNIQVGTGTGDDTLTVDYAGASLDLLPSGGLVFDGGENSGDDDRLIVTGYSAITAQVSHTGTESGNVQIASDGQIQFSNIEPLTLSGSAANLSISLPAGSTDAVLSDDGGANDDDAANDSGFSAIDGSGFEFTEFANPSESLQITTNGGSSVVQIDATDSGFAPADLVLSGAAGDIFRLGASNVIPDGTSLTVTTVRFDLNGKSDATAGLNGNGVISNDAASSTSTLTVAADDPSNFSGVIQNGGSGKVVALTKAGSGTLVLSGANTYTGVTTINAGTLQVAGGAALPNAGVVVIANVAGAVLDLNGTNETIGALDGGGAAGGEVALGSGTLTVGVSVPGAGNFGGVISGAGSLHVTNSYRQTLSGNNTYQGGTLITGGAIIDVTSDANLGNASSAIAFDSGTIQANETLSSSRPITVSNSIGSGGGFGVASGKTVTLNSQISGAGAFDKSDFGTLILANAGNSYQGGTTLFAGVLEISDNGNLGAASAGMQIIGGTLGITQSVTMVRPILLNNFFGVANFNVAPGKTLTLNEALTDLSGSGGDPSGFTKSGSGTLILSASNTYTGNTSVDLGTLLVHGSLSTASAAVTVNSNSILGGTGTINRPVNVNGGTLSPGASTGVLNTGAVSFASGSVFLAEINGNTTAGTDYDQVNVTGTVALNNAELTLAGAISSATGPEIVLIRTSQGVNGQFNGKPEGSLVTVNGRTFQLTYAASDGAVVALRAPSFTTGEVFAADSDAAAPRQFMNVGAGGNLAGAPVLANLPGRALGQIAWSHDLTTAYVTMLNTGEVVAVFPNGSTATYATGITDPMGLIMTSPGRLLVGSFSTGAIYDITGGGNFSGAPTFATGLSAPRNFLELPDGTILIAERDSGEVTPLGSGGDLSAAAPFAFGLGGATDLARLSNGRIFASSSSTSSVFDITAGGNFSSATPFATGQAFSGLTVDSAGRLLAIPVAATSIFNISAGGDFSSATPFAFNLPLQGEAALDTVPSVTVPTVTLIALDGSGNLVINDTAFGGKADTFTVQSDVANSRFVISDPNNVLTTKISSATGSGSNTVFVPFAAVGGSQILINARDGDDNLTVDFSLGVFSLPVVYDGGNPTAGAGDSLTLVGGNFNTITHSFSNAHDGNITFGGQSATIAYTGLEPVDMTGSDADNLVFNLPAGGSTAFLEDDGTSGNGISQLRSGNGSFETTLFTNPNVSLTINRGNATDDLIIAAPADFTATLTIGSSANAFDQVTVSGTTTAPAALDLDATRALSITAAAIAFDNAGGTLPRVFMAGTATLIADNVALTATAALVTTGGTVSIAPLTAGRAIDLGSETAGQLSLTDAELDLVGADTMNIGNADTGTITVSNAIEHLGDDHFVVTTGRNIVLNSGTSWTTTDGDLTFSANQQAIPTAGDFAGIDVNGANIASTSGDIALRGRGGDAVSSQHGVHIHNGGIVGGSTSGAVTVEGTGGSPPAADGSANFGVWVFGAGSRITSGGGNVSVTGVGGGAGTGGSNIGVVLDLGGVVTAGGTGAVTVMGAGGAGPSNLNLGVLVRGATTQVTSSGGDVSVTGVGGGSGSGGSNIGVEVDIGGVVTAGGSGSVTVMGTAGTGTGFANYGVVVRTAGAQVTSGGGNVSVTGQGGGAGSSSSNFGVFIEPGGTVTAGGIGSVTVQGTGGAGEIGSNFGVYLLNAGALITSSGGNVSVTGQGGGAAASGFDIGVFLNVGGVVTAGGTGAVTVQGSGGFGSGGANYGVFVSGASSQVTSGGAAVSVTGTAGAMADSVGVQADSGGRIASGSNAAITVTGDSMSFLSTDSVNAGAGPVTLQQETAGTAINVGGADGAGVLGLTDAELDRVSAGTINIGNSDTGTITVTDAIEHLGDDNFVVISGRNIVFNSGTSWTTLNGDLSFSANQQAASATGNFVGIDINGAALSSTGTGDIALDGRGGDTSRDNHGVHIHAGGAITGGAAGSSVAVIGTGGAATGIFNIGVLLGSPGVLPTDNTQITSTGGNVSVTGTGGGAGASFDNLGIYLHAGTSVSAAGAGTVLLNGAGGSSSASADIGDVGVYLFGVGTQVTSGGGNVSVTGQGGGAGTVNANFGVVLEGGSVISAGGAGSVTVEGTAGAASTGNFNDGIVIHGAGSRITSSGGNVAVIGAGGGAGGSSNNIGVRLTLGGVITAAGSATVTVTGTSGAGSLPGSEAIAINDGGSITSAATGNITIVADSIAIDTDVLGGTGSIDAGSNSVFIRQQTDNTAINLGGADAAGVLGLTDAELDRITAGTISIGNANSGPITVSASIDHTTPTLNITTGGGDSIIFSGASAQINLGGGTLNLSTGNVGSGAIVSGGNALDAIASTLTLTARAPGIGAAGNPFALDADTLSTFTGGNGDQFLREANSLQVAGMSAGAGAFHLLGGTFNLSATDAMSTASALVVNGATLSLGAFDQSFAAVTLTAGSITGTTGTLTSGANYDVRSGTISAALAGNVGLTKTTASAAVISGAVGNTYTGTTTVNNGLLILDKTPGTNAIPGDLTINFAGEAVRLNASNQIADTSLLTISIGAFNLLDASETIGALQGSGGSVDFGTSTGSVFTVGDSSNRVFGGIFHSNFLAQGDQLVKTGTGTLTLTGANEFDGSTSVNQGTLLINSPGSWIGPITVNSSATLGGTGTISDAVQVNSGGTVAPGTSPGILNTGSIDFSGGGAFTAEVNGPTPGIEHDQINVTGSVTLGDGVATLNLLGGYVATPGQEIILINNDLGDPVTGYFTNFEEGTTVSFGGFLGAITYQGGDGNDVSLLTAETEVELSGGNLIITDISGGTSDDLLTISLVGANVRVVDPVNVLSAKGGAIQVDAHTVEVPLASITGTIQVNTLEGNDLLTVDYAGGAPLPSAGLDFDGGENALDNDQLVVTGYNVGALTVTFTGAESGLVQAGAGAPTIRFDHIEPLRLDGTAADIVINLPATANDATLEDDGTAGNGVSRLRSTNGTFEVTPFNNPTSSLTINAGAGADNITIANLPDFNASLIVHGDGDGDSITLSAPLNLGSATALGDLLLDAETINLNAGISTDADGVNAGSVSFVGDVILGSNVLIDTDAPTADGSILFDGSVAGSAALALNLTAGAGDITFTGTVGAGSTEPGAININSARDVEFQQSVAVVNALTQLAGAGTTTFNGVISGVLAPPGQGTFDVATDTILLNTAPVVTAASVSLHAQNAIVLNVNLSANDATINIAANQDGLGVQGFTQAAGATIQTSNTSPLAVNITVNTAGGGTGDASLALVAAGAGSTITIQAHGGAIVDNNGGAGNITGGFLDARAATGIDLDTNVDSITAITTGAGSLSLDEFDGVTLTDVTAADGPIVITTGGATLALNVVSQTDNDANDIRIRVSAADLNVITVTAGAAGGDGDVTLEAPTGNIFDDGNNATVITGDVLRLDALRAIGQPGAAQIDTTANALRATSTGFGPFVGLPLAGIWAADTSDLIVFSTVAFNGTVVIDANGHLDAQSAVAFGNNSVRLRALGAGSNLHAGSIMGLNTVFLQAAGAITDADAAHDITAGNLMMRANGDIGSALGADPLETAASFLAYETGSGSIDLINNGSLALASLTAFGQTIVGGSGAGHATVTTFNSNVPGAAPFTLAANAIMGGDILFTAGEADDPFCEDDLTVNPSVTVQSTGGNVTLRAGDDIILGAGATIQAALAVELIAGFNDLDNCGDYVNNGGTISAGADLAICAIGDLPASGLTAGGAVSLRSMDGAIIDINGATVDIVASALAMKANAGIGVGDALETIVAGLEAETVTGGIFVGNTGDLAIGGVTPADCVGPLAGVRVTGASGAIDLDNSGAITIVVGGDAVVGPSAIDLTATTDILTGGGQSAVLSSGGAVTLDADRDLLLGDSTTGTFGSVIGGGSVALVAGRHITVDEMTFIDARGAGAIDATAGGNITLARTNVQGARITSEGGAITLRATGAFLIDADGSGISVNLGSGPGADVTICGDTITLDDSVNAGGSGTVRLAVTGDIIAHAGIRGGSLGVDSQNGSIDLDNATNQIASTFAAQTGGVGANIDFQNENGFATGQVTALDCFTQTVTGVTTPGGRAELVAVFGALTLGTASIANSGVSAGTVLLHSVNGNITQTVEGAIVAPTLAAVARGDVTLCAAPNQVSNAAISMRTDPGLIEFHSEISLTIIQFINPFTGIAFAQASVNGLFSTGGDINVRTGSSLFVDDVIDAGGADVRIVAAGAVNQDASSRIRADELGIRAGGDVTLCESTDNDVNLLAVSAPGLVEFHGQNGMTIGTVLSGGNCGFTDTVGISDNGATLDADIALNVVFGLHIEQAILAGTGDVRIVTDGFNAVVDQTSQGAIVADELGISASAGVNLAVAANNVNILAISTTAGGIDFHDVDGLTIGTVSAGGCDFTGATGLTTIDADINLCIQTGDLSIDAPIDAGAGTVRLAADTGSITRTASGVLSGAALGVRALGDIVLDATSNFITSTFAAATGQLNAAISFRNAVGFATGHVDAAGCFDLAVTGVTTNGGPVGLCADDGTITIGTAGVAGSGVHTGVGDVVRIQASSRGVTQTAEGAIVSDLLGIKAATSVTLTAAANDNNSIAIAAGFVEYRDVGAVTISSIAASGCFTADVFGVSSNGGNINLQTGGNLLLNDGQSGPGSIDAGSGAVRIVSGGFVVQVNADDFIRAGELGIRAAGPINLVGDNDVNTLAASTSSGGIDFRDLNFLNIGLVATSGSAGFTTTDGLTATNADINLCVETSHLSLSSAVNAGAGMVRFAAPAGGIAQTPGGTITGTALSLQAGQFADLDETANVIASTLAAAVAVNQFHFRNLGGFTIGQVAGGGCVAATVTGVTVGASAVLVSDSGPIAIGTSVAGTGITATSVSLRSGAGVEQTALGIVNSATLLIQASAPVLLCAAVNDVNTLAVNTTGLFEFNDGDDLTIDSLSASSSSFSTTINGVSSNGGDINLQTGTSLTVNRPLDAGTADERIVAGTSVTGNFARADQLGIRAGTTVSLFGDVNAVAIAATGSIIFVNFKDLAVGTVITGGNCGFTTTLGVVSSVAGIVRIETAEQTSFSQDLTILAGHNVQAVNGPVLLIAGDDFTLEATATIQASAEVNIFADFPNNGDGGIGSTVLIAGTITNGGNALVRTGGDEDDITLLRKGTGPITLDGGGGNDSYFVQLGNLLGAITVNDAGGSSGDNLDVAGTANAETVAVNNNSVTSAAEVVNYSAIEFLDLFGLGANDTFNIRSTNAATTTLIDGGAGEDAFNLSSDAPATNGNLDDIQGPLTIQGGSGVFNRLIANDASGAPNTNVILTNSQIQNLAPVPINYLTTGGQFNVAGGAGAILDGIVVRGSNNGGDSFTVASTLAGSTTRIEGLDGADTFANALAFANNGDLDVIAGRLTVFGSAPGPFGSIDCDASPFGTRDVLFLNDRADGGQRNYVVGPNGITSSVARPFAGVFFDGTMDYVRLDGTDDVNVFDVSPSQTTQFFIDGNLPPPGVCSPGGGDFLRLNTAGTTGRRLHIEAVGKGHWGFTSGHKDVCFESIERFNHVDILAVANARGVPVVKVYDAETFEFKFQLFAYEGFFKGGVRVATGDVNCDGLPDLVTASGPGRRSTAKAYNGAPNSAGQLITSFDVYRPQFKGGFHVAVGDVNHDGANDIITGADAGWLPMVSVFDGTTLTTTHSQIGASFLAFGNHFRGGVRVAAGDINNDGRAEIIAATGAGLSGRVNVYNGNPAFGASFGLVNSFLPFGNNYKNGLFVAVGDVNGDGIRDLVTSVDKNWLPLVSVFNGNTIFGNGVPEQLARFQAFRNRERTGVRVAVKPVDGAGASLGRPGNVEKVSIVMSSGPGGRLVSRKVSQAVFNGLTPTVIDRVFENARVNKRKFVFNGIYVG